MRLTKKFLIGCGMVLSMLASAAFAQGSGFASIFDIPANDVSKILLEFIFGQVEGVWTGGSSLLLGNMFSVFNSAALAIGGVVILYTLVVSTLNTAHEGEVMGKKWSSVWIPIRSALGVGLLLPKASGYSMIQIFLLWVVLQGIGAADTIWAVVTDYVNTTGSSAGINIKTPSLNAIANAFTRVVKMVGCADAINHATGQPYMTQNPTSLVGVTSLSFGGAPGTSYDPQLCGTLSWSPVAGTELAYANAIQGMIADAHLVAQQLILSSDAADPITPNGTPTLSRSEAITNPALNYLNRVGYLSTPPSNGPIISDDETSMGWILAGGYYQMLAKSRPSNPVASAPTAFASPAPDLRPFGGDAAAVPRYMNYISDFLSQATGATTNTGLNLAFKCQGKGGGGIDSSAIDEVCSGLNGSFDALAGAVNPDAWVTGWMLSGNQDPILQLQQMGMSMIDTVEEIWIMGAIIVLEIAMAASVMASILPFAYAILAFLAWFVPMMMSLLLFIFMGGVMLAYFVPMIPFLLYTFGAIGWITSVIEAVIAGPIVALGVLHPEGHEIFGEAKAAIMLLFSVFLRPSLLIFGLVTAISLSYAGVALMNFGFALTLMSINIPDSIGLTTGVALIILYVSTTVSVVTYCCKMIVQIPNRILRWIGGNVEGFGEEQAMGEAQSGFRQGMEGYASGLQKATGGSGDLGKAMKEGGGKEDSGKGSVSQESGGGGDSGGGGGGGGSGGGGGATGGGGGAGGSMSGAGGASGAASGAGAAAGAAGSS